MDEINGQKVVSLRLDREIDLEIRRLAVEKDLSRSALIREALMEKLERERNLQKAV